MVVNTDDGTDSNDVVPGSFDHSKNYYIWCCCIKRYQILLNFA